MDIASLPLKHPSRKNVPDRIVVHAIGEFIDTDPHDYYCVDFLAKLGLSAHAFVTPSGVVIRSVPDHEEATHAKSHNRNTLGIEFMVPGLQQ